MVNYFLYGLGLCADIYMNVVTLGAMSVTDRKPFIDYIFTPLDNRHKRKMEEERLEDLEHRKDLVEKLKKGEISIV